MVKILISILNSLFFSGITLAFDQNWAVSGLVAVAVWLITLLALCLTTMAHRGDYVLFSKNHLPSF